ncbi:MAG TPA: hypothetical protein VNH18_18965 [Bryobacteraceae bacterium]|nr:hypothetical protein [Bryobacteraceae bacterium]
MTSNNISTKILAFFWSLLPRNSRYVTIWVSGDADENKPIANIESNILSGDCIADLLEEVIPMIRSERPTRVYAGPQKEPPPAGVN